jgi:hypothetical protein
MSPTQGPSNIQYVHLTYWILAPVCPHTLAAHSRAAGHRHSPLLLLTADPCQPRLASRRPRSPAASRCPRSSPPSCVAPRSPPGGRPHSSSQPLIADNAHRRSSPPRGSTPRLATQSPLSSCRSCPARRKPPAAARRPRPVQWPAAEPPAARRSSPLSAAAQARRPCPPGAPARHSPLQVISVGQPVAFTPHMYLHACSGPGGPPARLFTHLQADYM